MMECPECGSVLNQRHTPSLTTPIEFWCECGWSDKQ